MNKAIEANEPTTAKIVRKRFLPAILSAMYPRAGANKAMIIRAIVVTKAQAEVAFAPVKPKFSANHLKYIGMQDISVSFEPVIIRSDYRW